jgi:hypothetical protein
MAELSEEEKNEISHRGRALKEVIKYLKTVWNALLVRVLPLLPY